MSIVSCLNDVLFRLLRCRYHIVDEKNRSFGTCKLQIRPSDELHSRLAQLGIVHPISSSASSSAAAVKAVTIAPSPFLLESQQQQRRRLGASASAPSLDLELSQQLERESRLSNRNQQQQQQRGGQERKRDDGTVFVTLTKSSKFHQVRESTVCFRWWLCRLLTFCAFPAAAVGQIAGSRVQRTTTATTAATAAVTASQEPL